MQTIIWPSVTEVSVFWVVYIHTLQSQKEIPAFEKLTEKAACLVLLTYFISLSCDDKVT